MHVEQMTIKDKLYFTTGDITILDDDMTMVQLFNKDALAEIKPDVDIYKVVKDKKWTLEYLETLIKDMNQDLNGGGKADKDDQWGMCLSTADILTWYNAAGEVMVAPDGLYEINPDANVLILGVFNPVDDWAMTAKVDGKDVSVNIGAAVGHHRAAGAVRLRR